jgi:hypothetical protein
MNGHTYAWDFGNAPVERVTHFIGFMQGAVGGLHFWMVNTVGAPLYF